MKKLSRNQRGFSHHFILPVLAFIAVGAIGAYIIATSSAATPERDKIYSCSVKSGPKTVKKGNTYTEKVSYKNTSSYPGAIFTGDNTNPLMSVLDGKKYLAEETPLSPTSYSVRPGTSFTVAYKRGTSGLTKGHTYKLKFVMYEAASGDTTKLMMGTSCSASIKIV